MTYTLINPTQERRMLALRLLSRVVERPGGCLEMTGYNQLGYTQVVSKARGSKQSHVISYGLFVGPVPRGYDVHHQCENKACVEPSHLECLTRADHIRRHASSPGINASKTHCKRGHEFTPENTYHNPRPPRGRRCRTCVRASNAQLARRQERQV